MKNPSFAHLLASILGVLAPACAPIDDATGTPGLNTTTEDLGLAPTEATLLAHGYGHTPGGFVHGSCVHRLAEGDAVEDDGSIRRADGHLEPVPACAHPRYRPNHDAAETATPRAAATPESPPVATDNGWIEDARWWSPWLIGEFIATFHVPAAPSRATGQTVFLFPALQGYDGSNGNIIQPVLQFGDSLAGGGNYWAIASWYGGESWGGNFYTSPLMGVLTGEEIRGTMVGNPHDCTGAGCLWTVTTARLANHTSTSIAVHTRTRWTEVVGGALEAYGVNLCSQYPATYDNFFYFYVSQWGTNTVRHPTWTADINVHTCHENVTSNASIVNLYY